MAVKLSSVVTMTSWEGDGRVCVAKSERVREREREREMGSEVQFPFIDISGVALAKDGGEVIISSDDDQLGGRWKSLCSKVREALESHGCFVLFSDKMIPMKLREDMFVAMESLFQLPEETKTKYSNPRPYRSYLNNSPVIPLHESFGIDNEPGFDAAQAFTQLMWPEGNPSFRDTMELMTAKMLNLNNMILRMVFESFGTEKLYDLHTENSTSVFRIMKYKIPPSDESAIGLVPHTDKNTLTILCQNDVQGLEVLNKDGEWVAMTVPSNALIVIAGDGLKAWSNGRLTAAKHRVVMSGKKERYSFGLFSMPKEGVTIEVPQELVDEKHPLLYRPFKFSDYFNYFVSNISEDALEIYAAL